MSKQRFEESIDTFKVKFEGGNSIDAELFARTINSTVELVKASAKVINPEAFLRLEIKATKEGSFETIIDAIVKYSDTFFTKVNLEVATEIIAGFLGFLQIKKLLGNKKAKTVIVDGNKTTITNQEDQHLTVLSIIYNHYITNSNIDSIIVNQSNDLKSGERNIVIESKSKKIELSKEDYDNMSKPREDLVNEEKTANKVQTIEKCLLIIKKPDLIGNSQWEVILDKKISVKISDETFLSKIKKREIGIYCGDGIVCDLQISTKLDEDYNVVNTEYIVLKVHDIRAGDSQFSF